MSYFEIIHEAEGFGRLLEGFLRVVEDPVLLTQGQVSPLHLLQGHHLRLLYPAPEHDVVFLLWGENTTQGVGYVRSLPYKTLSFVPISCQNYSMIFHHLH